MKKLPTLPDYITVEVTKEIYLERVSGTLHLLRVTNSDWGAVALWTGSQWADPRVNEEPPLGKEIYGVVTPRPMAIARQRFDAFAALMT